MSGAARVNGASAALLALLLNACGGGGDDAAQPPGTPAPPTPPVVVAPTVTLSANAASVASGESVTLTWASTNATSCTASGGWSGAKATSGNQSVGPLTADLAATLECTGAGGSAQDTVNVTVTATPPPPPPPPPPPAPTVTLSAAPTTVASGANSQLTWSSTNATSCTASGAWSGAKATAGSQSTGALTAMSIFNLQCTGAGGSAQASVTVNVTPPTGSSAISGNVDSSYPDIQGDNRVYVFAGTVTPDDDDGDAGDPLQRVVVTQNEGGCGFSYAVDGLAAGTYTLAFTRQAQNDRLGEADTLAFSVTTTLTVAATPLTQHFTPASVLRVGPGRTYSTIAAAANAAAAGAVIEVDAGTYPDDVVVWRENRLTVRGVGGRAHVQGTRVIPFQSGNDRNNGMGLWVVRGTDMRVENIEFSGARVDDQNGAGIRNQGRNLTICNSVFRDGENGILGGAYGQLTIEYSTFARNGAGDVGRTHNLYIDEGNSAGDRLVFRHNYTHHAQIGHLLKTRARENWILYNRIMDEADGTSSYAIDVPNGGLTYVIGNLIQQGPDTDNSIVVAYGAEGLSGGRTHSLYVVNNTLVNDRGSGAYFDVSGGTTFRSANNLFVGSGTLYSGTQPTASNNLSAPSPGFVDRAGFDYRLTSSSPAINGGADPGSAGAVSLAPVHQYVHPASRQARPAAGVLDIGAYEYVP